MTRGTASPLEARPVAVCVPAHGSSSSLRTLAAALRQQDLPRDSWLLVVAVDGPDEALETVAREVADIVVVLAHNAGSYAARNAALDALPNDVELVVFTDTDCRPVPEWLRAHVDALRQGAPLTGGAVAFDVTNPPTAAQYIDSTRFLQQEWLVQEAGFAATCNLGCQADVVRELRFDARLRSGGDREFGLRAGASGRALTYVPGALVRHPARRSARAVLRKTLRTSRGLARLRGLGLSAPTVPAARRRPSPREWLDEHGLQRPPLWGVRTLVMGLATSLVWHVLSRLPRG
jgi:glycosyltransferase involved in cell wall biosynthesis